jgi:hypothetical protein
MPLFLTMSLSAEKQTLLDIVTRIPPNTTLLHLTSSTDYSVPRQNSRNISPHQTYSPYEATLFQNTNSSQQLVREKIRVNNWWRPRKEENI